jgi:hypothetical protein
MYNKSMVTPLIKTKSLIISGAVTSGKTLLTNELEKEMSIRVINETTTGNYYKIVDSINPYLYSKAIFEHCWIYKKHYLFKHLYEKNLLVILSLSHELLLSNYNARLSKSAKGDFSTIDPVKQQSEILDDVSRLSTEFVDSNNKILTLQINSIGDYKLAKDTILEEFAKL